MSFVGYLGWCGVVAGCIVYVMAVFFWRLQGYGVMGLFGMSALGFWSEGRLM